MPDFSIGLDYAWQTAAKEATGTRHEFIEPEHLFVGVCKLGNLLSLHDWSDVGISRDAAAVMKAEVEAVAAVFQQTGCDRIALYREVRKQFGDGNYTEKGRKRISRSSASRLIFERAVKLAVDTPVVTSLHLLLALIETPSTAMAAALAEKTPGAETLKKVIFKWITASPSPQQPAAASFLQHFGKDLTQLARDGKISPCIGRRDELLQIIRALSRETKSNPLLLGDAGVGKTAIVEGLAWRIAQNKDAPLTGKRLVQLNVADLVAGASSRGDFEARMQGILREVAASPDVILFIDEIHSLVGAGAGSGPLDAANIMKPALARGELRCIGATTQADGIIVQALESLQLIESLAAQGIRFTFFLFPSEDTDSMSNLLDLFYFAGDRVDYVIVHNPAKVRTNLFKKSHIEAELKKFGAREITLPTVTTITLLAIKRAEERAGRKLSFAEVATTGAPHLELLLAGEMQWAMQRMFQQYDVIADLMVPLKQMPEVAPQPEPEAKPARSKQPMLNLGE